MIVHLVAPYAGAWIEILPPRPGPDAASVAPYAGAWIEIDTVDQSAGLLKRRSLRGSVD